MLPGSAVKGLDAAYGGFFIRFQSRVYFENTSSEWTPAQSSHVPQATGHWAIGHRPESAPNAHRPIAPGSGHGPGQQVPRRTSETRCILRRRRGGKKGLKVLVANEELVRMLTFPGRHVSRVKNPTAQGALRRRSTPSLCACNFESRAKVDGSNAHELLS